MGRKSTKENKNMFQQVREINGYSREEAAEKMNNLVTADKLVHIESNEDVAKPYDVVQMAKCYNSPELCNYYCSKICDIGKATVPVIELKELPSIVLSAIDTLNEINPLITRLVQISKDGVIEMDEKTDFVKIKKLLEELSLASDALNLWAEKNLKEIEE